jgi:hypothetical protein
MICSQCGISAYGQAMLHHQNWHKLLDNAIQGLLDWRKCSATETPTDAFVRGYRLGVQDARNQYDAIKSKEVPTHNAHIYIGPHKKVPGSIKNGAGATTLKCECGFIAGPYHSYDTAEVDLMEHLTANGSSL